MNLGPHSITGNRGDPQNTLVRWALKGLVLDFSISNQPVLLAIRNYWSGYRHDSVTDMHWEMCSRKLCNGENEDTLCNPK
jgi:hypothetical protein